MKVLVPPWVKLKTCPNSRFLSTNVVKFCDCGDGTILELGLWRDFPLMDDVWNKKPASTDNSISGKCLFSL